MKIKLTIRERALLFEVLPASHNAKTMVAVKALLPELGFNEEETRKYGITTEVAPNGQNQIRFDNESSLNYKKEFNLDKLVVSAIIERLKTLDGQKRITLELLDIYKLFI